MPRLSNLFGPRDPAPVEAIIHRLVQRQEIDAALRLILADDNGPAGDVAVLGFLQFAVQRKIDVNQIWVTVQGNRVLWALLPITCPGRTMLLFAPTQLPRATLWNDLVQLVREVCNHWAGQGMQLAQFLIDPKDKPLIEHYLLAGFEELAELIYLQKQIRETPEPQFPAAFELRTYSDATHTDFAAAISQSYEGSLDCPALNGRREVEDIISGHKSCGYYDPSMWYVLRENQVPRGVMILSPSHHSDAVELVYLGLTPEARHRGLGDAFMRLAMQRVVAAQRETLTLAVDARNTPAIKLYLRYGMQRLGSRIALVRDLNPA